MELTHCKLGDVLQSIYSGGTPSTTVAEYWGGPYKWMSSGETGQRFVDRTIETITERGIRESSTKLAKRESVVMACAGQGKTRGQTSYLLDDMYVNQSVIVLNPYRDRVLPLYLFYNLSNRYEELRGGSDASSTRGSITTASLKTLVFQYPSIDKQEKMISILYTYDNLIEVNNKRIKALEQIAENLYKEWFVRLRFPGHDKVEYDNGIPKGWSFSRLDTVFDIKYGKDHKSIEDGTIPIFGSGGLMRYGNRTLFDGESVLIPRKGSLNNVMYYNGSFWTVDTMFYTITLKHHFAKYAYYTLSNIDMESYNSGAALPSMTTDILYHMKILVPDDETLAVFDRFVTDIYRQKNAIIECNENLVKQRDLLLPRLMSGKMEV